MLKSGATWLAGLSKTGKAVEASTAATAGKVVDAARAAGVSGAEKVVKSELAEVLSAATGVKILGKRNVTKIGPVLFKENTSLYSRTGQSTGVEEFDKLFSQSAQFETMTAALERRGVSVIDDASRLDPTASAQVFRENGKLTLICDSKTTPFLDMLHEARHVAQIQRAEASGAIGSKDIFGNSRLLGARRARCL